MGTELEIMGASASELAALVKMFGGTSNEDLASGIQPSMAVVSFKGKVWRIKHKSEEIALLNTDGDPVASLQVVIVRASPHISKLYYAGAYQEGDDSAPDCYSVSGVKPAADAPKPQSESCATCRWAVWGSKITENGQKAKACSDSRRLAVVPAADVLNEGFGGPMLLRVPPASLQELVRFADQLNQSKVPYQAIAVKLGFDQTVAYPKLVFTPVRALTIDEAMQVKQLGDSASVERVLNLNHEDTDPSAPEPAPATATAAPKAAAKPKAAATAKPQAVVTETTPAAVAAVEEPELDLEPKKVADPKTANDVDAVHVDADVEDMLKGLLG